VHIREKIIKLTINLICNIITPAFQFIIVFQVPTVISMQFIKLESVFKNLHKNILY